MYFINEYTLFPRSPIISCPVVTAPSISRLLHNLLLCVINRSFDVCGELDDMIACGDVANSSFHRGDCLAQFPDFLLELIVFGQLLQVISIAQVLDMSNCFHKKV